MTNCCLFQNKAIVLLKIMPIYDEPLLSGPTSINPFTARVDDGVCDVVLTFTSVDKILWCNHSNEISLEVLSCGVICFKKFYKIKFGIFVEFAFGHIWQ